MATPFKLKSGNASSFKNLGSSPVKQTPKDFNITGSKASTTPKWDPTKRQGGDWIKEARKQKAASTKDIFHEHVKIAKSRGKNLVKKGLKKASKFLGGKALGVAGMMMATSSKADQPKLKKGDTHYRDPKKSIF